jgi:predicted NBD/HSP70 family sugar kinase
MTVMEPESIDADVPPDAPTSVDAPTPGPVGQRSADSPRLLREINDQVVLRLLLDHGQLTRGRIGELTGLSKPTVSSLLARLETRGLVTTTGVVAGGPGPNARIYAVHSRAAHVVGVHVEQGGCFAGIATLTGELLATFTVPVERRRSATPVGEISAAVDGLLSASGLSPDAVHRVVVATPGVIDPTTGRLRHARHIRGWEAPGLIEDLTQTLGIPVIHGNDVNLAAVAEGTHGVAQDSSDYALLWLDRGVGLGLVLGGALRAGAHGGAGEIGYLGVPGVEAPRADRGGTGGFQQLVGGQGLKALARKYGVRGSSPSMIVSSALTSGSAGQGLITELATGIAVGAAAVTNLIDPGLLVLGGPVALAGGQRLLDLVVAHLHQISFVRPPVVLSGLASADGVLQGAIEVALQSVRSQLFGQAPTLAGIIG